LFVAVAAKHGCRNAEHPRRRDHVRYNGWNRLDGSHRRTNSRDDIGLDHVATWAVVIVDDALLVEGQILGTEAEFQVQRSDQEHGVVTDERAVTRVELFRVIIPDHLDSETGRVVATRMNPGEQRVRKPIDPVAGYEPVRTRVPTQLLLIV
jgi:hypothetical protein